jgi:hypothetical protein
MTKKVKGMIHTTVFKDAVEVRGVNKETIIQRLEPKVKNGAPNLIRVKSLTANTGKKPGVRHNLSYNGKVKYSAMGLSDEAVIELYMALNHYIKNIINNQIK